MPRWNEADHPRNPRDGKFVNRAGGTPAWMQQLSGRIDGGRGAPRETITQRFERIRIEEQDAQSAAAAEAQQRIRDELANEPPRPGGSFSDAFPDRVPGVQIGITDRDGDPVDTEEAARDAIANAFGVDDYDGELENLGGGVWMAEFPQAEYNDLVETGSWRGGGYGGEMEVEAEFPDVDPADAPGYTGGSSLIDEDMAESFDQGDWEAEVRRKLRARGLDPADVEEQVEGFGQDFFEYQDDVDGYLEAIEEDIQQVLRRSGPHPPTRGRR